MDRRGARSRREDLANLVLDGDEPRSLRAAVMALVEEHRTKLLPRPDEHARVWFAPDSGVDSRSLVYEQDDDLCIIAFDQG